VGGKKIAVKKYVVWLSAEERAQLGEFIRKGKRSARLLTKIAPRPAKEEALHCRGA
jgi:hypothetical protein